MIRFYWLIQFTPFHTFHNTKRNPPSWCFLLPQRLAFEVSFEWHVPKLCKKKKSMLFRSLCFTLMTETEFTMVIIYLKPNCVPAILAFYIIIQVASWGCVPLLLVQVKQENSFHWGRALMFHLCVTYSRWITDKQFNTPKFGCVTQFTAPVLKFLVCQLGWHW